MAPLASHHTTGEAPADYGDSDSYIGGFQASRKMDEATRHQAPGISASDERCKEKPSIARSRSTNTGCVGLGSSKTRRKSTGSILACISALQCLLTGSTDPNSGPPYVERFRPLNKPPHFQNQLKSKTEKEAPALSTVSTVLAADDVPGEAFVSIDINKTSETSLRPDKCPHACPRPQSNLPTCSDESSQTRQSSDTSSHFSNEFFEIRRSGLSGVGAFAVRDLKKGQKILTEPVLLKADAFSVYDEYDKLTAAQKKAYNSLFSHCPEHATELERIRDICDKNSFYMGRGLCGVYLVTARFNHACPPARNVISSFKGARQDISLRMTKDVTAGTELTLTYASCSTTLYQNWGFVCSCGGCVPLSQAELASINAPPTW